MQLVASRIGDDWREARQNEMGSSVRNEEMWKPFSIYENGRLRVARALKRCAKLN